MENFTIPKCQKCSTVYHSDLVDLYPISFRVRARPYTTRRGCAPTPIVALTSRRIRNRLHGDVSSHLSLNPFPKRTLEGFHVHT